jgi:putative ABC transport system permease protein
MNSYIIAFKLAWRSLTLNLLRTSLTVLGVIVGATAIVVVFAAGDALNNLILSEVESYGTDIIQTEIKVPGTASQFPTGEITSLKLSDMAEIDKLMNIKRSYAALISQARISYESERITALVFGVSVNYPLIDQKSQTIEGRFFSEEEDLSQSMVAVIGFELKEKLFPNRSAINEYVNFTNRKLRVIGVLEERGGALGFINYDEAIYLPIKTLQKKILGIDHALYFVHQLNDVTKADETAEEMRYILRDLHNITDPVQDDFRVSTIDEALDIINNVTGAITGLLLAIILISLLVGGVGIMNIMYVVVSERTKEIGLRKALGAKKKEIVKQFLIESVLITFWGWLVGAILGLGLSRFLIEVANNYGVSLEFIFPLSGIIVAFIFSIACGLIFGLKPAKKASKLDPVEAMRVE